jgi:hypothetical protein
MGRVQLNDSWTANTPIDLANDGLRRFFTQQQMIVVQEHAGPAIEVRQGSQLITRLLGGWFVNPKHFPKRAEIRLCPSEKGLRVDVLIEETLGLGFLDSHFKSRYEGYFQYWMDELKRVLPPVN